jgi:2'-5' RNA ligase
MSVSIELLFDEFATRRCVDLWRRLESRFDCRKLSRDGGQPHLSLALIDEGFEIDLDEMVETVALNTGVFELRFTNVSQFDSAEGVVFLEPESSEPLLHCHELVHHSLRERAVPSNALYAPELWIPHSTVAIDVPIDVRKEAASVAAESLPISTLISTIRAFHYGDDRSLAEHGFRGI